MTGLFLLSEGENFLKQEITTKVSSIFSKPTTLKKINSIVDSIEEKIETKNENISNDNYNEENVNKNLKEKNIEITSNKDQNEINYFGQVGALNHQYLQADHFSKLILEIDYENSTPPNQNAIKEFVSTLKPYVDKPQGIVEENSNSFTSQKEIYTTQDILEVAQKNRTSYSQENTISLYVIFLNGSFAKNKNALGLVFNSSTIVIFKDKIKQANTSLVFGKEIEHAVLNHEFGHLLGLVNIYYQSDISHEDLNNTHHSNNKESVMFWAVEDVSVMNILRGGPPTQFDSDDISDIRKIKNNQY